METTAEVARLKEVYREYAACRYGQAKWSNENPGNLAIQAEREIKMLDALWSAGFLPLTNRRILDVGCGTGERLGAFLNWGAKPENLFGIDLLPERIRAAEQMFPQFNFQIGNAESLPYADGAFDLVAVCTVFTSILNRQMAVNIGGEINRVLARKGAVLWYDFRVDNPFNKHVRGMTRRNIRSLFPGFGVSLESVSLMPPLARRLGALTNRLYVPLSSLPFLRTHLLGLLTKP